LAICICAHTVSSAIQRHRNSAFRTAAREVEVVLALSRKPWTGAAGIALVIVGCVLLNLGGAAHG
jgi:hypothetical protein